MRARIAVLSFTLFIILMSQISLSLSSSLASKSILATGTIVEPSIKKHLVVYPYTIDNETAVFIASHFDLVDFDFVATRGIEKVKALNPKIVAVGYRNIMAMYTYYEDWSEVNAHENWFLHDVNGNRLVHKVYGWYAMDVGISGWREHFANLSKAKLDANSAADGLFADDVWEWVDYRNNEFTVDPSLIPPGIQQRWHNDMVGMIQHVKNVIGSKLLILNTNDLSGDYLKYADGMMLEGFIHASWEGLYQYNSAYLDYLNKLEILSSTGKDIMAQSGTSLPTNPTESDLQQAHKIMLYCLGSVLLGASGSKVSFGWLMLHSARDGSRGYYPEMDCYMGAPKGKYYVKDGLYIRDFEYGWVLVNFSTDTRSTVIDGTTYTLEPRSAIIIEK